MSRRLRRVTRPIRHALAYAGLRTVVAALRCLPTKVALRTGELLGRAAGLVARRDTRRMRRHLALLPNPPSTSACWADLGRRFAELVCARRLLAEVEVHGEALAAEPRPHGALVATAHLGNWELMAAALAARGHAVHAVAARAQRGPLFRWLDRERAAFGVRTLHPGDSGRRLARLLGQGASVALFVDQATRERSRPIPFLGRPAPTPVTLERLQALTGARVVFAWTFRDGAGRHHVHLEPVEAPTMEFLTARVEALVSAHPTQWVWLHDRWRW